MHIEPADLIDTRLRVATWNVWWRFGPWKDRQPAIAETLRGIWTKRTDRYSELRTAETAALPKVEMSYIGG